MATSDVQRKLTAIFCTDVVGYSRLMGDDPEGTLQTLTDFRAVFSGKIGEYGGRVVNAPGDSILADFASVVDAVSCAVDIQRELAERNQQLPDHRRMDFRIGVNLGDVLVKEGALYGDGVNVAARMESLADPGGICISGKAYEEVKNRLPLRFEYLGQQAVKNIAEPVKSYRVLSVPGAAAHRVVRAKQAVARVFRKAALTAAAAIVLLAVVGGYLAWQYGLPSYRTEEAALPLPDEPSIAVLAFDNLSGDPEQEYFSDGISEDIITRLAKNSRLFVIARSSSFSYKGKALKVQQIGRELGVRYLLEGSVQKADHQVRITAQLIEAATGKHLWAERYDRALENLFDVQDEITVKVVLQILKELEVKITPEEIARIKHDTTVNVKAWEDYAEGMEYYRRYKRGYNSIARWEFEEALELDPEFEPAILGIGWTRYADAVWWSDFDLERAQNLESAMDMARRALALNDTLAEPYVLLSQVYLARRQHEQAIAYGRRAIALNPNRAEWYTYLAGTLNLSGNHEEALRMINKAMRFSPFPSDLSRVTMGRVLYQEGRYEEAINNFRGIVKRKKVCSSLIGLSNVFLAASFGALGRPAEFPIILFPTYPIEKLLSFKDSADEKRLLDDLAKAKVKSRRG